MPEPSKEERLENLIAQGLVTEEEAREARRLLEEAGRAGRDLPLTKALLQAGAIAAKAHHAPAAPAAGDTAAAEIATSDLELIERISRGRQAVVYKCRQKTMDRLVAVKILPPSAARESESRRRFFQEARYAARLSHPNIVTIHQIRPFRNTCRPSPADADRADARRVTDTPRPNPDAAHADPGAHHRRTRRCGRERRTQVRRGLAYSRTHLFQGQGSGRTEPRRARLRRRRGEPRRHPDAARHKLENRTLRKEQHRRPH